jgi:mRNA-degrading endonuclease toxin of MazEF toxin-antitoxin module
LPKDSVALASGIVSVDKQVLTEHVGRVSAAKLKLVLSGIDIVFGR